jgi:hypothetical protein
MTISNPPPESPLLLSAAAYKKAGLMLAFFVSLKVIIFLVK